MDRAVLQGHSSHWSIALFTDKTSGYGGPCPLLFPTLGPLKGQGETCSCCYLQLETKVEMWSSYSLKDRYSSDVNPRFAVSTFQIIVRFQPGQGAQSK